MNTDAELCGALWLRIATSGWAVYRLFLPTNGLHNAEQEPYLVGGEVAYTTSPGSPTSSHCLRGAPSEEDCARTIAAHPSVPRPYNTSGALLGRLTPFRGRVRPSRVARCKSLLKEPPPPPSTIHSTIHEPTMPSILPSSEEKNRSGHYPRRVPPILDQTSLRNVGM